MLPPVSILKEQLHKNTAGTNPSKKCVRVKKV